MRAALVTGMILFTHVYQLRTAAAGIGNKTRNESDLQKANLAACNAFKCGPPQPRVFNYSDVMHDQNISPVCENVKPHVTVLYRCDETTGYCESPESWCRAQEAKLVQIVFLVSPINFSGGCSNRPHKNRYVETTALNHTHCACEGRNHIK